MNSDAIVAKYGMFCMKLLRYCIEAVQKKQEIKHEEFLKYAKLGKYFSGTTTKWDCLD